MGDAKDGFKKAGSSFTTDDPSKLTLQEDKDGPFYDERVTLPLVEEMVANIVSVGVQQPVIVSSFEGKLWIVEGRQRFKHWVAALKVWKKIGETPKPLPVIIRQIKPNDGELIGVSCNEHRQNDSPLLKITKAARMLAMGWDEETTANSFGIQVQQLKNWLKADSLCATVKKKVENGEITISAAAKFHELEPKEQIEKVQALIDSGAKPTVKNAIKATSGQKPERKGWTRQQFRDFAENEAMPKQIRDFVDHAYFGDELTDELDFLK